MRRALASLGLREACEQQRQLDVPFGGEHRQEVVELEDEPDVSATATATARRR